jgi:hypothetical protein
MTPDAPTAELALKPHTVSSVKDPMPVKPALQKFSFVPDVFMQ